MHNTRMANNSGSIPQNYIIIGIIVVAVLGGAFYFTQMSNGGDCVVKLGHILPTSGPLAAYAGGFQAGVQAAVIEANDQGGIDGCTVELIEEDSATDAAASAAAAVSYTHLTLPTKA